ncbi:MAG: LamG-like jellyroll fold domain-containing protein, partial [Kofleriaceae bacterium]
MSRLYLLVLTGCGRLGFETVGTETSDASVDAVPFDVCAATPVADTVALYTFEGSTVTDATGAHSGTKVGDVDQAAGRCGTDAIGFPAGTHVRVPDSPAFDLAAGSIELFVQTATPAVGDIQGILSRDAVGTDFDGHLSMALGPTGQLWVRMQRTANVTVFRCTAGSIPANQWVHVGVSFGSAGFRLWLDHTQATGTTTEFDGGQVDCTTPHPFGIDGNDNTLVLGALDFTDANADPEPGTVRPFTGGQIDQVHLHSTA